MVFSKRDLERFKVKKEEQEDCSGKGTIIDYHGKGYDISFEIN